MSETPPPPPPSPAPQEESTEDFLTRKFPNLKPKKPPLLGRINGCGFSMFGKRDMDTETGTYIKSYGITLLWIPLLTFSAYRVADAENGGWYFLGKEKITNGSKFLNFAVLALIAIAILGIRDAAKKNSPEYRAQQTMDEAAELASDGRHSQAADLYLQVASGSTPQRTTASESIPEVVLAGLESTDDSVKIDTLRFLAKTNHNVIYSSEGLPDPYEKGLEIATGYIDENTSLALEILAIVKPIAGVRTDHEDIYISIYNKQIEEGGEQAITARQNLALLAEASGNSEAVLEILEPVADDLDTPELHRVYGQALADFGRYIEAIPHLEAFTTVMTDQWKEASETSDRLYQRAYEQEFEKLDTGMAPESFYTEYEAADEATQNQMVNEYLHKKISANGNYHRAEKMMERFVNVTPAIMTLGIAHLRHGQQLDSDKERDKALAKAEESFLSLKEVAGESTDYQFFLGQVYYWMNKPAEGKELFDSLIANNPDNAGIHYSLAQTLREVGEFDQALELAKKAHEKAVDENLKKEAASFCAIITTDTEEKIEWLEKTDLTNPANQSNLLSARADLANSEGDDEKAVSLYRQSLKAAPNDLNDAVTLNNRALVHSTIYYLTGEMNDLNRSVEYFEKAVTLNPNNSILCGNTASALYNAAIREVLLTKHSTKFVQLLGSDDQLRTLYDNESEREEVIARLRESSHFKKAVKLYEKAKVLAPQDLNNHSMLFGIYSLLGDYERLEKTVDQLERAQVDTTSKRESWEESMRDEDKTEALESMAKYAESMADIREQLPEEEKIHVDSILLAAEVNAFDTKLPADLTKRREALENALESAPSSHLRSTISAALSLEAYLAAKNASPEFALWAEPYEKSLGSTQLLLLGIHSKREFSNLVRELPEVIKFADDALAYYSNFPKTRDVGEWILAETFDPASASEIADRIKANTRAESSDRYVRLVAPYSPTIPIVNLWTMKMEGQDEAGEKEYAKAAASSDFLPEL